MASKKGMSKEEKRRLSLLFHAYDEDDSGRIEKDEFFTICKELHVPSQEVEKIFNQLDVDKDGTVTLEEFISGFNHQEDEDDTQADDKNSSKSEEELSEDDEQAVPRWDTEKNACLKSEVHQV